MERKGYLGDITGFRESAKAEKMHCLTWLTNQVVGKLASEGKDFEGRDFDVRADLRQHVEDACKKFYAVPGTVRADIVKDWAIDSYGVKKEMEARGITGRDTCEKFSTIAYNTQLFPAFLATSFIEGRISAGLIDLMVSADVQVDRMSYDKLRLNEAADDRRLRNVGIGANLPETEISSIGTTIKLLKYGRLFRYAREFVDASPVNIVAGFARKLGRQVAVDETDEALEILHAGDGETGSSVTDTTPATNATLVYNDLVTLDMAFDNAYSGDVWLATSANFRTILQMSEYKDPLANRMVSRDRNIPNVPTPSGAGRIWRWSSTNSTYMAETGGRVAALDSSDACYTIRSGDPMEESMLNIENGKICVAISYKMAVVKGDPSCFASLDVTA